MTEFAVIQDNATGELSIVPRGFALSKAQVAFIDGKRQPNSVIAICPDEAAADRAVKMLVDAKRDLESMA